MRDVLLSRGVLAIVGAIVLFFVAHRWRRWVAIFAVPPLLVGLYLLWYTNRGAPDPIERTIREGVVYRRLVAEGAVVHVLEIDLRTPGLTWLGTPSEPTNGRQTRARTTSQFLAETNADLAINTAYFAPWHSNTLLDYYPHVGDPVDCIGAHVTNGVRLAKYDPNLTSLWVAPNGELAIDNADHPDAAFIWSGFSLLARGRIAKPVPGTAADSNHPRTAAGLNAARDRLVLVVVDGRQPSYSEGIAFVPLANLMKARGVEDAVLFDGGGSTTMVVRGDDGPDVLNTPVHGRHPPGLERPVACHLGARF